MYKFPFNKMKKFLNTVTDPKTVFLNHMTN